MAPRSHCQTAPQRARSVRPLRLARPVAALANRQRPRQPVAPAPARAKAVLSPRAPAAPRRRITRARARRTALAGHPSRARGSAKDTRHHPRQLRHALSRTLWLHPSRPHPGLPCRCRYLASRSSSSVYRRSGDCLCVRITAACSSRTALPSATSKCSRSSSAPRWASISTTPSATERLPGSTPACCACSGRSSASPASPSILIKSAARTTRLSIPAHSGFTASWASGRSTRALRNWSIAKNRKYSANPATAAHGTHSKNSHEPISCLNPSTVGPARGIASAHAT